MKNDNHVGVLLTAVAFFMVAVSYASVPLYRLFCQKTGYGGTIPDSGKVKSDRILERTIIVQFTANTHRDLPWVFKPLQHSITLKLGENGLAYYWAENTSQEPMVGMATYNISPDKAAPYFNKIECFCFEEQFLAPQEGMKMPVFFFIDPEFAKDPQLNNLKTITLSYTFFRLKKETQPNNKS